MDELELRLQRLLTAQADSIQSHISGPAIRAKAAQRASHRYVPALAAASVIAVIAAVYLLVARDSHHGVVPAGPGTETSVTTPAPESSTTNTPLIGTTPLPTPTLTTPTSPRLSSSVNSTLPTVGPSLPRASSASN